MTSRNDLELSPEELADVKEEVSRLREWVHSTEGADAVREASERSAAAAVRRAAELAVDLREFDRPITC